MKTAKELLIELQNQINYACYDETISSKMTKVWHAFFELQESLSSPNIAEGKVSVEWQRCPICNGVGRVQSSGATSSMFDICSVCNGAKIIAPYIQPPIGLRPKWVSDKERLNEIWFAIVRYYDAELKIPVEWIEEYNKLIDNTKV